MRSVAAVGRLVDQVSSWRQIDDIVVTELVKGGDAAAAVACKLAGENAELRAKIVEMTRDFTHLQRIYAESRAYVDILVRERDELVEAARRAGAEVDSLDAWLAPLREVLK